MHQAGPPAKPPVQGQHGTLIANAVDKSFDFYSKGEGCCYHFSYVGGDAQWRLQSGREDKVAVLP